MGTTSWSPVAFPDYMDMESVYTDVVSGTTGAGTPVSYFYRGNGLSDPQQAAGGHQPYGFDTFCGAAAGNALFNRYTCISATFEVISASIDTTAGNSGLTTAIRPVNDTADTAVQPYQMVERARCPWGVQANTGAPPVHLRVSSSTAKQFGVNPESVFIDDTVQGTFGAVPTREWFFHLCVGPTDLASNVTYSVTFKITYKVRYFQRNRLSIS
jgi:hypothetical protein